MLREFKQLRQEPGDGSRRWFESDGFDLVVWLDTGGALAGFQICYDLGQGEHALTWRPSSGCVHHRVDMGDHTPFSNESPVLVADGVVPWSDLLGTFDARCASLEPAIRDAVKTALTTRRSG